MYVLYNESQANTKTLWQFMGSNESFKFIYSSAVLKYTFWGTYT